MYAAGTRGAFLCARAADVDVIRWRCCCGIRCRPACGRSRQAWRMINRVWRDVRRWILRDGHGPLDNERRRCVAATASDEHAGEQQREQRHRRPQPMRLGKPSKTLIAESATGPDKPAESDDLLAALAAEVGTIAREDR